MRIFRAQLVGLTLGIFAFTFHQSYTLADDYLEDDVEFFNPSTLRSIKDLTPEEQELANEARAHIAKTIENNLVRLLATVSARGDRRPRQDDEDDDATPNPNVLPQVAQILGAIFTGGLNITRVVDRTFGLVPNVIKSQVGGIVKLLTGENTESSTVAGASVTVAPTTAASETAATSASATTTVSSNKSTNEAVIVEVPKTDATTTQEPLSETTIDSVAPTESLKGKYRVRNRTKGSTTTTKRPLEDDEIEKLQNDIRRAARAYESDEGEKDPRVLAEVFRNVFQRIDFNMSEIASAVPSIFKGTRQAFVVLDNLGILDVNDVLDELDLPALEEEEE